MPVSELQRLKSRLMAGEVLPAIHTVGFFAEEQRSGPGERFLRQLSALTGGTFQVLHLWVPSKVSCVSSCGKHVQTRTNSPSGCQQCPACYLAG